MMFWVGVGKKWVGGRGGMGRRGGESEQIFIAVCKKNDSQWTVEYSWSEVTIVAHIESEVGVQAYIANNKLAEQ